MTKQPIKITVEYPCGHVEEYKADKFKAPEDWYWAREPSNDLPEICPLTGHTLSHSEKEKLR